MARTTDGVNQRPAETRSLLEKQLESSHNLFIRGLVEALQPVFYQLNTHIPHENLTTSLLYNSSDLAISFPPSVLTLASIPSLRPDEHSQIDGSKQSVPGSTDIGCPQPCTRPALGFPT